MSNNIEKETFRVIAEEFGISVGELDRETVAVDVDGWDSLRHIQLILKLEAAFDTEFDVDELSSVDNVGSMIDMISKAVSG